MSVAPKANWRALDYVGQRRFLPTR